MAGAAHTQSQPLGSFVHLHVHSNFSLLDGAAQIPAMVKRAKELGMGALALTDHGAMYGIIDFYEACHKEGIKPILGVEAYVAKRKHTDRDHKLDAKSYHLLLLAETYEGYLNLIELTSAAHLDGVYYKPRVDKDLLRKYSKGIIATSGCPGSEVPQRLMESYEDGKAAAIEYREIFGETNYFIEIQSDRGDQELVVLNERLHRLAKELDIPLVCTNDVHYLNPDDAEAQDVLVCVSTGKTVNDPNRLNMTEYDLSMKSPAEMAEMFADYPESLANTVKIAERCNVEIPMGINYMPIFPLPEEFKPKGKYPEKKDRYYLRKLCEEGMMKRYGFTYKCSDEREEGELLESPLNDPTIPLEERAQKRLEYELSVIEKMGFESYFLITQDFLVWGRKAGIMLGPGRGSAAGSFVGYLLYITNVDPLFHNLIFERFLNPERVSMPDIDNDIEDTRRDELIDYVRRRYGSDHVAQIITFGTMAARAAVRDVGRALGVSYAECDYLAKLIPSGPGGMTMKEALDNIQEIKDLYTGNDQIHKVIDLVSRLEGVARHTSIHAAGVVVTREPLTHYVPIQRAAKNPDIIITQYAMNQVEHIGLLKVDMLGLSNLGIIQKALRIIRKTHNVEIDLDNLPLDDAPSYALLARAESTGVFQLESSGMKRYLKELKPTQFEDIVAMVALYRPGPMDAIPDFIEAKHGRRTVTYLHPILEPILKNSYGVIVTQDQVLEVARKFAGFSYGQADVLRKAVGKKIKSLLDEQSEKFINGAIETNGVTRELAQKVWDFVEPFARYGFNRAHAVCYAMIAYQTAYLKAHYPEEFMAALLTSDIDNLDRIGIEIAECREMHIEVLPPNVNESFVEFGTVLYPEGTTGKKHARYIRFGLGAIKNVGQAAADRIVEERKAGGPYLDFTDFVVRNAGVANKKVIENLAMAGAFDSLIERAQILHNSDEIVTFMSRTSKERGSSQIGLFEEASEDSTRYQLLLAKTEPTPNPQRLAWERELLGIYLSDHPMSSYLDFAPNNRMPIVELNLADNDTQVTICGVIMGVRTILTKKNTTMAFVALEDETGATEIIVFPKTYTASQNSLVDGKPVVITGKVSRKANRNDEELLEVKILADGISTLSADLKKLPEKRSKQLTLHIPSSGNRELLQRVKLALEQHEGYTPVVLMLPGSEGETPMPITQKVKLGDDVYGKLVNILGGENIEV